jgi:antitoxin PrlF
MGLDRAICSRQRPVANASGIISRVSDMGSARSFGTTVMSKGRITIPADVGQALQVVAGDRVEFVEIEPVRFEVVAATRSITELRGMFGKTGKNVSIEEMNRAAARGASDSQPIGGRTNASSARKLTM